MNWWDTWTSRGSGMKRSRSSKSPFPGVPTNSQVSLPSVQKTCGLFNTERASNSFVASQAMKPGIEAGTMESFVAMATEEGSLGGIFQDLPMDLTEADYLDSFMDLSNFLVPDESGKVADDANVDCDEMKGKVLGFSGLISSLDTVSPAYSVEEIMSASKSSPRKRKHAETSDDVIDTTVNESHLDVFSAVQVYDHDYVSKRVKVEDEPEPSTSKVQKEVSRQSMHKYRQRRDKNNVASKRSREIRKMKYKDMDKEADQLEIRNEALRKKIVEMEKLAKAMKAELIQKMTQK